MADTQLITHMRATKQDTREDLSTLICFSREKEAPYLPPGVASVPAALRGYSEFAFSCAVRSRSSGTPPLEAEASPTGPMDSPLWSSRLAHLSTSLRSAGKGEAAIVGWRLKTSATPFPTKKLCRSCSNPDVLQPQIS